MCGDDVELTYSLDTLTHVARLFVEEQVAQGMDESGAASRQVHSFLRFIDRHGRDGSPSTAEERSSPDNCGGGTGGLAESDVGRDTAGLDDVLPMIQNAESGGMSDFKIGSEIVPVSSEARGDVLPIIQSSKSKGTRVFKMGSKIVPVSPGAHSHGLLFLRSPEAERWAELYNSDLIKQTAIASQMRSAVQHYSEFERKGLMEGVRLLDVMNMKTVIPFESANMRETYSSTKHLKYFCNTKEGDMFVSSSYKIRGTIEAAASYVYHYELSAMNPAFGYTREVSKRDGGVIEVVNTHHSVVHEKYNLPPPSANRDTILALLWERESAESLLVVMAPLETHPKADAMGGSTIRGSLLVAKRFVQVDNGTVLVQFSSRINFGGKLPKSVIESAIKPGALRNVKQGQTHHMMSLALDDLRADDGKMLGEILINQIKKSKSKGGWKQKVERSKIGVDEFLYISVAMRSFLEQRPWFRSLLHTIAANQVAAATTVMTSLDNMNDQDAVQLGKGLSTIIISNTESPAAIDHWIAQNGCLGELEEKYSWTRKFFIEFAKYNLATSNFGLVARVCVGAVLSVVDLATDIFMTVQFFQTKGQEGYGRVNAILIGLTLGIQILTNYAQNHRKLGVFVRETAVILSGFKPAVDAYRVGAGIEQEQHQTVEPLAEMSVMKTIEVVFEAVPSSVIQIYAYITSEKKGFAAAVSIIVSAATTAYASTMITYGKSRPAENTS